MASRSLGTLTLDLVAKIGGFTGPIEQAGRSTKKWQKDTENHAKAVGIAIGAGVAAAAGALVSLTASTVRAADEISRFAALSNTSTTDFQKLAAGADVVGVSQEKLSDIFKDVNDKVGDFLNTGGGELKDFFDKIAPKVGVTADQFRNLSGPDALGLFVSSLEKAGASQADMTFYMEGLANDATLLLPLLKNNAEGFKSFGAAALAAGSILDDKTIKSARELSAANWLIKQSVDGVKTQIATALLPTLANFATQLNTTTANGVLSKKVADDLAESFKGLSKFALGTVAGIHLLANGLKTLSELDDASMGEGAYWERWVPPARIFRAFQSIDAMKATLSDAGLQMDQTAQGYADLLASFDKPAGTQGNSQVKELADLLDRLRNGPPGTLNIIPPDQLDAAKKAAQEAAAVAKQVNDAFSGSETDFLRQIELINTSADAQKKATEVDKLRFEIASGKLVGINGQQQKRLESLAAELDVLEKLKLANEEEAKSSTYLANLKAANATIKSGFDSELAGAGMGDKARDRLRQDLAIQQDYNSQMAELQKQLNAGEITKELYAKETGYLKESLDERVVLQDNYYQRLDQAQADWMSGVSDAWNNYRDQAADTAGQAKDLFDNALSGTEDAIVDFVKTGKLSFKDLADSIIEDLIRIQAKKAIVGLASSAFSFLSGGSAALGTGTMTGFSEGSFVENAKGGVYDSPSLSTFSNGVYNTPQTFAFAKGAGIFAEAGPEAIMPLTRGADGSLGVRALGGGNTSGVEDRVSASGTAPGLTVHQVFHVNGEVSQDTLSQMADMNEKAVRTAVDQSLRHIYQDARQNGPITQSFRKSLR